MNKRELYTVLALAAIARLIRLGAGQFWYDEAFTVLVSRLPLPQMFDALAGDVHPPGYYLITWVVAHLGFSSAWAFRLPSVVFSLLAVWMVGGLSVYANLNPRGQRAAVYCMAFIPLGLHYAQEARMYALLQTLVLWAVMLLLLQRWGLLALATTAILYTHNYGLLYGPALALVALIVHPGKWRAWLPALLIPVVCWLPWAAVLFGQMAEVAGGYWIQPVTLGEALNVVYKLFWAFAMPSEFIAPSIMVVFGLVFFVAWRLIREQGHPRLWPYLVVMAALPFALAVGVSLAWKPILLFRPLVGCAPFFYILAAWAWSRLSRIDRLYMAVLVVPVFVAGVGGHYLYNAENKGDVSPWIEAIRAEWQEGDAVLSVNDNSEIALALYAPEIRHYKMPACGPDALGALSERTRAALGFVTRDPAEIDAGRLWIIYMKGPTSPACTYESVSDLIGTTPPFMTIKKDDYTDASIYLYDQY